MFSQIIEKKVLNRCSSVELVISEKCQNSCKYCYRTYKHNKSPLFALDGKQVNVLLNNFLSLFKQDITFFKNRHIELFGGDPMLDYTKFKEIINVVSKFKPTFISVPTNGRMLSELTTYDIEDLINSTDGVKIGFSLSVDGSPSDTNRPLSKIGKMLSYTNKIDYDKLINIAKKFKCGFHPMLDFGSINTWLDTTKFFIENYNILPYLLEIRHPLSKEQAIKAVRELVKVRNFLEEKIRDPEIIRKANTIVASRVPRGLGCSALTTLCIMPNGDIPFCHRVIDPPWVMGNVFNELNISKAVNFTSVFDHRNHPYCIVCPIRRSCSGLCLGANYEYWGDPWIPIESICDYQRLKAWVFSRRYQDWKNMIELDSDIGKLEESVKDVFGEKIYEI